MEQRLRQIDGRLGERLRARREALGLSQYELALAVALDVELLQRFETAEASLAAAQLIVFCEVLEVPLSYFWAGIPR